jgi:hypothetical protein
MAFIMTDNTLHPVENEYRLLALRLDAVRSKFYVEEAVSGALAWGACMVCLVSAAVLTEYVFNFPSIVRTGMAAVIFILGTALLGWLVLRPVLKKYAIVRAMSLDDTALLVGRHFPGIGDHLLNLFQLARLGQTDALYSSDLLSASLQKFSSQARGLDFSDVVSRVRMRRGARVALAACLGFLILLFFPGGDVSDAANRLIHFKSDFTAPTPFAFIVTPGSINVIKNESVSVTVRVVPNSVLSLAGPLPREIMLVLMQEGVSAPEVITLRSDTSGMFAYVSPSLKESFTYTAESGDVKSETYSVHVTDRPFIRSFAMRVSPPRYARQPEQKLEENVGDATALAGSLVQWDIRPSKEIGSGSIVLDGGKRIPLVKQNGILHG